MQTPKMCAEVGQADELNALLCKRFQLKQDANERDTRAKKNDDDDNNRNRAEIEIPTIHLRKLKE